MTAYKVRRSRLLVVYKMIRQTIAAAMLVAMVGAGCSFSPVYSDGSPINAMSLAFDLGKPNTRLEQIVYQDLALRFAVSSAPRTPKLQVTVTSSSRDMFITATPPAIKFDQNNNPVAVGSYDAYEVSVIVTAVATYDGEEIFRAKRSASAQYTTQGQVLANNAAYADAEERAAKAAAESLRLAILARFPNTESYLNP